jgi:hypothetical protein
MNPTYMQLLALLSFLKGTISFHLYFLPLHQPSPFLFIHHVAPSNLQVAAAHLFLNSISIELPKWWNHEERNTESDNFKISPIPNL